MKVYDLFVSLGAFCSCTQTLRKSGLQFFSYPYDWMGGGEFPLRVEILVNDFKNWFNKEDLKYYGKRDYPEPRDIFINEKTGILYNHDFSYNASLDEEYDQVNEKFNRRIKRLISQIESADNVLFVYIENPDTENKIKNDEIIKNYELLKNRFKTTNVNLLYLSQVDDVDYKSRKEEMITENIKKIEFDYSRHNPKNTLEVNLNQSLKIFKDYKISNKFLTTPNKIERMKINILKFFKYIFNVDNIFTKNNKYKEITVLGLKKLVKVR